MFGGSRFARNNWMGPLPSEVEVKGTREPSTRGESERRLTCLCAVIKQHWVRGGCGSTSSARQQGLGIFIAQSLFDLLLVDVGGVLRNTQRRQSAVWLKICLLGLLKRIVDV